MADVKVSTASDYAVMRAGEWSFYYGYEVTDGDAQAAWERNEPGPDWCFQAKRFGLPLPIATIPQRDLGTRDSFDVTENLLAGIGLLIARGSLVYPVAARTPTLEERADIVADLRAALEPLIVATEALLVDYEAAAPVGWREPAVATAAASTLNVARTAIERARHRATREAEPHE